MLFIPFNTWSRASGVSLRPLLVSGPATASRSWSSNSVSPPWWPDPASAMSPVLVYFRLKGENKVYLQANIAI